MNEQGYIDLLKDIINNGDRRDDRTGVGVYGVFGRQLRFDLRNNTIPLLTTKRVYWNGVLEELLFFIKGQTNNKILQNKNIHIWDGNTSAEYLAKNGLNHLKDGDMGPIYGNRWRHFGADYIDSNTDYTNKGVDQLQNAINLIKNDPTSRRIVVSAWDATYLDKACLYPCHILFQFYVNVERKELSCHMYQRSVDCFLGLPFNIASYATLTHIIAKMCDLTAGELIMSLGDTHIYSNHLEQCWIQIPREIRKFPKINIKRKLASIDDYCADDFEIIGYNPHPLIKGSMAV